MLICNMYHCCIILYTTFSRESGGGFWLETGQETAGIRATVSPVHFFAGLCNAELGGSFSFFYFHFFSFYSSPSVSHQC